MSARLKLKRINDHIKGVMKMEQKAQYERDEIHRRFIANTVTLGIETSIDEIAPRLNENNVRIVTAKTRHGYFNDWSRGL